MASRECEVLRCDLARPHLKIIVIIVVVSIIIRSFVP